VIRTNMDNICVVLHVSDNREKEVWVVTTQVVGFGNYWIIVWVEYSAATATVGAIAVDT
jgi:hypothetical protein